LIYPLPVGLPQKNLANPTAIGHKNRAAPGIRFLPDLPADPRNFTFPLFERFTVSAPGGG
jgi:hypothetical protein